MCLYWGVIPLAFTPTRDIVEMLKRVSDWGIKEGRFTPGDRIVLVAGTGLPTAGHNLAMVHEVT